jgi:predicted cobalt transporter CbtA
MIRALLIRGMLAGAVAGLLAFAFAHYWGEPEIEYAIGLEEQMAQPAHAQQHAAGVAQEHQAAQHEEHEEELVSRGVQSSAGLLTAVVVYGAGVGGLFAIAFAFAYGRIGRFGPGATAALLAVGGFISIALVPFLKYPANPPSVGSPETLGSRTALFLVLVAISIIALVVAGELARRMARRFGTWGSVAIGAAAFVVIIAVAQFLLPDVREVPRGFAADMLWRFRMASLIMQLLMWTTLGAVFSLLAVSLLKQDAR